MYLYNKQTEKPQNIQNPSKRKFKLPKKKTQKNQSLVRKRNFLDKKIYVYTHIFIVGLSKEKYI